MFAYYCLLTVWDVMQLIYIIADSMFTYSVISKYGQYVIRLKVIRRWGVHITYINVSMPTVTIRYTQYLLIYNVLCKIISKVLVL